VDLVTNQKRKNGVKGLVNIGNTCFFNSIMQVLTHISLLRTWLLENIGNIPAEEGRLTSALRYFFAHMWHSEESPFTPRVLFNVVCEKAPRFDGYRQQDAQELLRYLLDNAREEEIKRIKLLKERKLNKDISMLTENEKSDKNEKQPENKSDIAISTVTYTKKILVIVILPVVV